jgi:hypothetical protein
MNAHVLLMDASTGKDHRSIEQQPSIADRE